MAATATSQTGPATKRVVRPADPDWDSARQAFNLLLDQRPEAIAFPRNEHEVAAVVREARRQGQRVAAQATGHNAGPLGYLGDTIIVNTSELTGVSIDAPNRRVRVGAATKWERVVPQLSELGLAALHGSSPDVGIVGYSLGGGMGWMARKHGLQTNSVTAFELVTAEGHLLLTDAIHEPELFWALRGGGGNFGVVTAVEFAVFPVERFYAGAMFFPVERAWEVLHAWHRMLPELPDELMTWANIMHFPDLPEIPGSMRGGSFTVIMGALLGDESRGRSLLRPVRALGPAMDTFALVPPVGLSELAMDPPVPVPYHGAHLLLGELSPTALDALIDAAAPAEGSPLAGVQLRHMGGALARKTPGAGARATLPGQLSLLGVGMVVDDASARAVDAALEAVTAAVREHRVGEYPNFIEEPTDASNFFDGDTWDRLRQVKALYDPTDLFKGNHHVPPAA
jgi:FAD/FMN-containing dehydrogenase